MRYKQFDIRNPGLGRICTKWEKNWQSKREQEFARQFSTGIELLLKAGGVAAQLLDLPMLPTRERRLVAFHKAKLEHQAEEP